MSIVQEKPRPAPDFGAIKSKQHGAWSSGDYALIGRTLQIVGEQLCETIALRPGSRVLDVAAGNGNATLAAARRFCEVVSTDYVESLLEKGRRRAEAEGYQVEFQTADVEELPFEDGRFDAVLSTFGAMFAPDHAQAAAEMLRVCRPGGKIGLANWTPEGLIGHLFKTIGAHVPPPQGVQSPALWGTDDHLRQIFGADAKSVSLAPRKFVFRYLSPDHFINLFRTYYGPVHKAFLALDAAGQARLEADLRALLDRFNTAKDGTLAAPSDYVDVVIERA